MVAAESGSHGQEHVSFLERWSPTQIRIAGVAAAVIGLAAATTPSELWRNIDAHASTPAPVPAVEQVMSPPARPWQPF